jgi:hypothetical protein
MSGISEVSHGPWPTPVCDGTRSSVTSFTPRPTMRHDAIDGPVIFMTSGDVEIVIPKAAAWRLLAAFHKALTSRPVMQRPERKR